MGYEHSKRWQRKYNRRRRDEEREWRSLNGPVTIHTPPASSSPDTKQDAPGKGPSAA